MKPAKLSIETLATLIEAGDAMAVARALQADPALVKAHTEAGNTLLHVACWQKQLACVAVVLAHRPDVNARGAYGRTPLHYAVHEGRAISLPVVAMLLAAGADPLLKEDNGFSVEDWAKSEMVDGLAEVLFLIRRMPEVRQ
jgi:ankyrin repeat protein